MESHRVAATIVTVVTLAACGSAAAGDETATSSVTSTVTSTPTTAVSPATTTTTTTGPAPAAELTSTTIDGPLVEIDPPSPSPARVEWAAEIVTVVNELQVERAVAAEEFNDGWQPGEAGYEAQRRLYDSDVATLRRALDRLPAPLADEVTDTRFGAYVNSANNVLVDAGRIAEVLVDREDELRTTERTLKGLSPEIDAILDGHRDLIDEWRSSCFDLQTAFAELDVEPLDCVGTGTQAAEPPPPGFDPDDVTVTVECRRGDSLDELPFDRAPYAWLTDGRIPPDSNWITTIVTITNDSDEYVTIDRNFLARWYGPDDETIVTTQWLEQFPPAFWTRPGQTVTRTGYSFEGNFVIAARDNLPVELFERVYGTAEGCEPVGQPGVTVEGPSTFIDEDFADLVEATGCERNDELSRFDVTYRVTNPLDRPIEVHIPTGLLDADGNRIGTTGAEGTVGAGSTKELTGWSVYYTITDLDAVDRCELFGLEVD